MGKSYLKKITPQKWPFILTGIWAFLLLGLGSWWLYLIVYLGGQFQQQGKLLAPKINLVYMVKWEGLTFLVLLFLVSFFLIFIYFQDIKKAKAMSAFFASVTHELKTPLASIRLQAEVMKDMLETSIDPPGPSLPPFPVQFPQLVSRLLEDTQKLENELEKILQLSRMERGGNLNPAPVQVDFFLKNFLRKEQNLLEFTLTADGENISILADQFALELILRNLVDNTLKHGCPPPHGGKKEVFIHIGEKDDDHIFLSYDDRGGPFTGEQGKLGKLFYTHNTQKGQGIGLYLIRKLMNRMNGEFHFKFQPSLTFLLVFPKAEGEKPLVE